MSYKDRYMLANSQFVLNIADVRDTSDHLVNPDKTVEWQRVVLIRVFATPTSPADNAIIQTKNSNSVNADSQNVAVDSDAVHRLNPIVRLPDCPICFQTPTAAKTTRCGHIYCWPCMLHYLALAADQRDWQKCPVCSEPVFLEDLKSCMPLLTSADTASAAAATGGDCTKQNLIKMVMMQREATSVVALPRQMTYELVTGKGKRGLLKFLRYGAVANQGFAKLLFMDNEQIRTEIYEWERDQLMLALNELENDPFSANSGSDEVMFIQQALQILESQMESLIPAADGLAASSDHEFGGRGGDSINVDQFNNGRSQQQKLPPSSVYIRSLSQPSTSTGLDAHESGVNFYQSEDGQLIFLCALTHRILMHEYSNDISAMPDEIYGRVVDVEHVVVSDDTRRRYKFLRHLPRMAEVLLVELDIREPYVGAETRSAFQREINNRAAARAQRHMREMRLKEKADKSLYPVWYQIKERHFNRRYRYTGTEIFDRDLRPEDFICEGGLPAPAQQQISTSPPFSPTGGGESMLTSSEQQQQPSTSSAASSFQQQPSALSSSFAKIVRDGHHKPRVEPSPAQPPARRAQVHINAADENEFPALGGGFGGGARQPATPLPSSSVLFGQPRRTPVAPVAPLTPVTASAGPKQQQQQALALDSNTKCDVAAVSSSLTTKATDVAEAAEPVVTDDNNDIDKDAVAPDAEVRPVKQQQALASLNDESAFPSLGGGGGGVVGRTDGTPNATNGSMWKSRSSKSKA